jgi:hypothetical protein
MMMSSYRHCSRPVPSDSSAQDTGASRITHDKVLQQLDNFNLCRSFADGDGIDDLTSGPSSSLGMHRSADLASGPQVPALATFSRLLEPG